MAEEKESMMGLNKGLFRKKERSALFGFLIMCCLGDDLNVQDFCECLAWQRGLSKRVELAAFSLSSSGSGLWCSSFASRF